MAFHLIVAPRDCSLVLSSVTVAASMLSRIRAFRAKSRTLRLLPLPAATAAKPEWPALRTDRGQLLQDRQAA
jgi:hypothetical protein